MNLMFWKKKNPLAGEEAEAEEEAAAQAGAKEIPDEEEDAKPGILARLRGAMAALRKRPAPVDGDDATTALPAEAQTRRPSPEGEPAPAPAPNMKKRLVLGAALGFVILLLAGIGFATWKWLAPTVPGEGAEAHTPPAEVAHAGKPDARQDPGTAAHADRQGEQKAPDNADMQAQIAALKKQNEQMQSELEALRKADREDNAAPATARNNDKNAASGEVLLSGKDPKASAQALKQAIEEMNAAAEGGKPRKPADAKAR